MIPQSLRTWFLIHFVTDMLFAIPLFIAPVDFLSLFGYQVIDPVTTRLVAAALFAIGGISLLAKGEGIEVYRTLLSLKISWSLSAVAGLVIGIAEGAPPITWSFVLIFAIFSAVWISYRRRLPQ